MGYPTTERPIGWGEYDRTGTRRPDKRFLINAQLNTELVSATAPITLPMNWHPETKKLTARAADRSCVLLPGATRSHPSTATTSWRHH
jgi:hypothetical protein